MVWYSGNALRGETYIDSHLMHFSSGLREAKSMQIVLLGTVMIVFSGCSTDVDSFRLISTRVQEPGGEYVKVGTFEGVDKVTSVLFFPYRRPLISRAVDSCLRQGGGDCVTHVRISLESYDYFLWSTMAYRVTGEVWKRK